MNVFVVIGVCVVVGYILEWFILKTFFKRHKQDPPLAGHLIVDDSDPEKNGGLYLTVVIDPKTFKEGQIIELDVWKVGSQEKHGIL